MKKILVLFFVLINVFNNIVYSQTQNNINSFIPATSENNSSNNGLSSYNVDYFSGKLNYTAPLKTVNILGIDFSINLNYNSNGIKVQDVSGSTGLGWTSTLGGQITREVHGIPDDFFYGYCGPNRTGGTVYSNVNSTFFGNTAGGTWDSEPDVFSFSFLGFSGTFVFDPDGKPLLLSNQSGIRIEQSPFKRGNQQAWLLRDQKGNKYYFENSQTMICLVHGAVKNEYSIYPSTWNITKVVLANNQQIDFTYTNDATPVNYTKYMNIRRVDQGNTSLSCLGRQHTADTTYNANLDMSYQPVYLSKISGNGTNINLSYNLNRDDLTYSKALTDISVEYKNKTVYAYKLNYGYFTSDDGTQTKRLKLNNISDVSAGVLVKTLYQFYYNEAVNLPARNSFKTDYLGYYNNNSQNSNINHYSDKTPYLENTKANILTKVLDISGGSVNFEYELNSYYFENQVTPSPGLRVKRVYQKKNEGDPALINQFTVNYNIPGLSPSSGQLFTYYSPYRNSTIYVQCNDAPASAIYYYSSETQEALADLNGSNVAYSNVSLTRSDGSSTQYTFTNYSDYPDTYSIGLSDKNTNYNFNSQQQLPVFIYGDYPRTSFAFARGRILKEDLKDTNGAIVKTTAYSYSLTVPSGLVVALKAQVSSLTGGGAYTVYSYLYHNQDLQLNSKTEKYLNAGTEAQTSTENYTYTDYSNNLLRSTVTSASGGRSDKMIFRYPFDVIPSIPTADPGASFPVGTMVFNNMIGLPLEVVHTVTRNSQEIVTSASITKYNAYGSDPYSFLPGYEYRLESKSPVLASQYANLTVTSSAFETYNLDSRMKSFKIYNNYDDHSNLLQSQSLPSGHNQAVIYGYDKKYKTAEITNAGYTDVAYTSFESDDKGNWIFTGTPVFDINSITGQKCYNLSNGSLTGSVPSYQDYFITYWTRNQAAFIVSGTQGSAVLLEERNGWRNYKHLISGVSNVNISGAGYIDEVRLYPVGSKMTTYTYEPYVGNTSKTDESNVSIYSEFDEYNRLQFIKDSRKNILQAYSYNHQGEQVNPFNSFTNSVRSGYFYKTDCGPGSAGSQVNYIVEAGRYAASTQEAADALAQNDLTRNGPEYANANGTCTSQTIYAKLVLDNQSSEDYFNDPNNFGSSYKMDLHINFYSDAGGTVPFSTTIPMNVVITETMRSILAYGGNGPSVTDVTYTIPAGTASYLVGHLDTYSYQTYTDPYSGFGSVTDTYYFDYDLAANSYYVIIPQQK